MIAAVYQFFHPASVKIEMTGNKKPSLLHIVPYDTFVPALNGGALRCYHLAVELSKYFELTVMTYQPADTIQDPVFDTIKVVNPKDLPIGRGIKHKIKNAILYRMYMRSWKGPAEASVLLFYPLLKQLAKNQQYDYVIMEHLSGMLLGRLVKRHFPKAHRIVDQHNIDHLLFAQGHDIGDAVHKKTYERLKLQESRIHQFADSFFACSVADVEGLEHLNGQQIKGRVVPNGTPIRQVAIDSKNFSDPKLIFCGSLDYGPNKNGLLWFYQNSWQILIKIIPAVSLTIIGRNGSDQAYLPLKADPQIDFVGEVKDVAPYYLKNNIAIVPLLEGSGTRLKVLEAMSFGNPVVSTSIGAEGIKYTKDLNILIADDAFRFAEAIIASLSQPDHLKAIAEDGISLIRESYDWVKVGADTASILNELK